MPAALTRAQSVGPAFVCQWLTSTPSIVFATAGASYKVTPRCQTLGPTGGSGGCHSIRPITLMLPNVAVRVVNIGRLEWRSCTAHDDICGVTSCCCSGRPGAGGFVCEVVMPAS